MPDVWHETPTGMEWCDCGCHCPLTKAIVREFARDVLGEHLPARITHGQVVLVAMQLWQVLRACRFFTMAVEDAAVHVNGTVAPDYPLDIGLAVVKAFSNRWNGCPEEACREH